MKQRDTIMMMWVFLIGLIGVFLKSFLILFMLIFFAYGAVIALKNEVDVYKEVKLNDRNRPPQ